MKNTNNSIAAVRKEIYDLQFGRLMVFSDMIDRYLHIRLRGESTWLRIHVAIFIINRGGKITPSELAKLLLRSRNSVTRLIEGLEKDGIVKRSHSTKDRRTVVVEITPAGLDFTVKNLKILKKLEKEIYLCVEPDRLKSFIDISRELRVSLLERLTGLTYKLNYPSSTKSTR